MKKFEYMSTKYPFKKYTGISACLVFVRDRVRKTINILTVEYKYRKLKRKYEIMNKLLSKVDNVVSINDIDF